MWCSTAWPITRSKESSSKGNRSASATRPEIVEAERAALRWATSHHARAEIGNLRPASMMPASLRFSVKKPVPQPSSSEVGYGARRRTGDMLEAVARVGDAPLVERDGPLVVVGARLPVVVQDVGQLGVVPGRLRPRPRACACALSAARLRVAHCAHPGEHRFARPVGQERRHPDLAVGGGEQRREQVRLQLQAAGQVHVRRRRRSRPSPRPARAPGPWRTSPPAPAAAAYTCAAGTTTSTSPIASASSASTNRPV